MYQFDDKFLFKCDPKWSFSKNNRSTLETKALYEHHLHTSGLVRFLPYIQSLDADKSRRPHSPEYKIGTEKRFQSLRNSTDNPGACYNPDISFSVVGQPKYSFGKPAKSAKEGRKLETITSTPSNVGPNLYFVDGYPENIVLKSSPVYKFSEAIRESGMGNKTGARNETYEIQ